MKAEIISIGDELLIGQVVNTNASFLARKLTELGWDVRWITTVGDHAEDLRRALLVALERSDVVIATGGLGPTHDDITKHVAAKLFGAKLVRNEALLQRLQRVFAERGLKMAKVNEEQALVPDTAELLENTRGTAPGLLFERNGKRCFILPGVPVEMNVMWENAVRPRLTVGPRPRRQRTVRTTGLPESTLFEKLGQVEELGRWVQVAFLPKAAGVDIRLTARGETEREADEKLQRAVTYVLERVGEYVYGYDQQNLEDAVAELLFAGKKTVSVAESCTGGLLAHKLTNVSGSSEYFERGVVAYSNRAKMEILGVPEATLVRHGAVSAETAEAMAAGVRQLSGTDFGVSTTGIAGPTGGTPEKPVGLVFIGLASAERVFSKRFLFFKDRLQNKERFAQAALNLLRKELLTLNPPQRR